METLTLVCEEKFSEAMSLMHCANDLQMKIWHIMVVTMLRMTTLLDEILIKLYHDRE